jgi:hypothetical protein
MVGSYFYYIYKNGRLVKRRSYRRNIQNRYGDKEYRYFGKNRLVRPIYKKGLHRYSKPWKHYYQSSTRSTTPRQLKSPFLYGYSSNQLWIGLCRAWLAFTIWKQKDDLDKMQEYGLIIHNLQKQLDLPLTDFDIYIGDEYDEGESKNKDGFGFYEDQGHYGDEKVDGKEGLYDRSDNVQTKFPFI